MRPLTLAAALAGLLSLLMVGPPAAADPSGSRRPDAAGQPDVRRHGASCPPTGCPGSSRSSGAIGLGFAAVVLATGLIARRGAATPR